MALAAHAAGKEGLASQSVQFAERVVVQRSLAPLAGVGAALAVATAGWWLLKPADGDSGLVRAALLCATLVALVPALVVGLGRTIPPTRLTGWLAARAARAEIARMVGIVAVAGFGLGAPLGLVMLQSSYVANAIATYRQQYPAGQVLVRTSRPLEATGRQALDQAAGTSAVVQEELDSPQGLELWASPNPGGRFGPLDSREVTVVADRREAAIDLGWQMPDADWNVVAQGKVLWLSPERELPREAVTFASYDNRARAHPLASAPAVLATGTPPNTALINGGAVMSTALASKLGLHLRPSLLRYPNASDRLDAITTAGAAVGIAKTDVKVDPGPAVFPAPMSFKTALALGLLLVGLGVFLVIAPSGRENRAMNSTLQAIGVAPASIRRLHLLTTVTPLLLGCAIGVVAGFGVSLARLLATGGGATVIPWAQVGLATGGVFVIGLGAIAVSWLNLFGTSPRRRARDRQAAAT